ncbi:MAG: DUF6968 family protein [Phreatobacter sp.]
MLAIADGNVISDVPVRLFQPAPAGASWSCRFEIGWPEGVIAGEVFGVDALQAVHLAMQRIAIDLYMSPWHRAGRLSWPGQGKGYGFPMARNGRDLLVGDDLQFDG